MVIKILVSCDVPEKYIQVIQSVSSDVEARRECDSSALVDAVRDVEVVYGVMNREIMKAALKLKWIHSIGAGVGRLLAIPEVAEGPVILTSGSGTHPIQISEHVFAHMLAIARKLKEYVLSQSEGVWRRPSPPYDYLDELNGKTVGIVGLGSIGSEVAKKAKCFGMRVLATKRRMTTKPPFVDELLPHYDLKRLLERSDFVVICAPLTSETKGMIGAEELASMKKTAYIVNIARGELIQQTELILALKEGKIAGAGLDVFETEPLSRDSELWSMSNVLITPHIAGSSIRYWDRSVEIFCENLRRYIDNKPMINVVDKKAEYAITRWQHRKAKT